MAHKKIRIPIETSIEVMEELGKLDDCIQFVDLNVHNYEERKNFGKYIERCDESLKNIQMFENMAELYHQKIIKYTDYETFKIDLENSMKNMDRNLGSTYFDLIENETEENNKKLKDFIDNYKNKIFIWGLGIGDWGLGIGDGGLGIGRNDQYVRQTHQ